MTKTIRPCVLAIALISFGVSDAHSQDQTEPVESGVKFTLGGYAGFPIGDFGDGADFAIGPLVGLEAKVNAQLTVGGRVGVWYLATDFEEVTFLNFPIWGGIKYYVNPTGQGGFIRGEAGINMLYASFEDESDTESELGLNLGGGFQTGSIAIEGSLTILSLDESGDSMMLGFAVSTVL